MTSIGRSSAGHLRKNHQQNIYWRIISRTSTGGSSAWHLSEDQQQDIYWWIISKTSTGGSSAGHIPKIISRTSTDGSSDIYKNSRTGYILVDNKQDIYWLTIRRTSTGGSSSGQLLVDHQQDIFWRIISRTSIGGSPTGLLRKDHQQTKYLKLSTKYWLKEYSHDIDWTTSTFVLLFTNFMGYHEGDGFLETYCLNITVKTSCVWPEHDKYWQIISTFFDAIHRRIDNKGLFLNQYTCIQKCMHVKYTICAYKIIHHCMNLYVVI